MERYKARWVVKGFSQLYSIDYDETFAPVVHLENLRLLLALATALDLEIHQMDVDSAFLHAHLMEEIYVTQPEGFVSSEHPHHVCCLLKSLYGLKQAPYVWNKAIDAHLLSNSFEPTDADPCIYVHHKGQQVAIISLYVDDCTILASRELLLFAKKVLSQKFKIKDLGEATSILGIEILRDRALGTLELCQTGHIDAILHQFNMENCKLQFTPMEVGLRLSKLDAVPKECFNIPYHQAIGKLLYLLQASRPDIAYAVNYLSRHINAYDDTHWTAVKHVLRYLQATCNATIRYDRHETQLSDPSSLVPTAYCDADWGGNPDDRRLVTGYIFYMCGGPFAWSSKAQSAVALSSCEAELTAISETVKQALYIRKLFELLQLSLKYPIRILNDNQSALKLANDRQQAYLPRMKHYDIKLHHMRDAVAAGHISLHYCPTEHMIADMLTKALARPKLTHIKQISSLHC